MAYGSKVIRKAISISAAILVAATLNLTAVPYDVFASGERSGIVTADYLNVRKGPGLENSILDVIDEGQSVVILETVDGWHRIKFGKSSYGWVSADYIKIGGDSGEDNESAVTIPTTTTDKKTTTTGKKTTTTTTDKKTTTTTEKKTTTTTDKKTTTTTDKKTTTTTDKKTTTTTDKKTTTTTEKKTTTTTTDKKNTTTTEKKTTTTTKPKEKKNVNLGNGIITVTGSYTNLRKGAGTGYEIIRRMYKGTEGGIIEKKDSWYKVKLEDSTVGWVSQKYVKATGYKAPAKSAAESGKIIVTVSSVNVRSGPATSNKLVATIRRNEVYRYSAVKDGWYKIVTPSGAEGYVCGDYVDLFEKYAVNGGGKYLWPTQTATRISSYFGLRDGTNHYGLDIVAPGGSQIIAVAAGTVDINSYDPGGYGYYIVIEQNDGMRTYYGHMKKASFLHVGAKVKAGDTIGIVGSTGRSTGNHLHLEFRKGTKRIDPLTFYPNMK